jgi:hypothetical protein
VLYTVKYVSASVSYLVQIQENPPSIRGKEERQLPHLVDILRMKQMTAKKENGGIYSLKADIVHKLLLETLVTGSPKPLCI